MSGTLLPINLDFLQYLLDQGLITLVKAQDFASKLLTAIETLLELDKIAKEAGIATESLPAPLPPATPGTAPTLSDLGRFRVEGRWVHDAEIVQRLERMARSIAIEQYATGLENGIALVMAVTGGAV